MQAVLGYDDARLKEIQGFATAKEIEQQPRVWKETVEIVKRNRGKVKPFLDKVLSLENIRVIFTGAGTSAYIGHTLVPYLNKKFALRMEAIATTEIVSDPESYLLPDVPTLLISFARSGNSPESVATVNLAEQMIKELYQIVITCNPEGELAKKTEGNPNKILLLMPEDSNDQGFAMTSSFSSMAMAGLLIFENLDEIEEVIDRIAKDGARVLERYSAPLKELVKEDIERVVFLGSSVLKGLATESALKVLELTRGRVVGVYESPLGLRHGPKTIINEKTLIFSYLSTHEYTRRYEMDLLKELSSEKKYLKLVAIAPGPNDEIERMVDAFWPIQDETPTYRDDVYLIFNYVLFAQMFALFKSIQLGITPDNPDPEGSVNRVVKGVIIHPFTPDIPNRQPS
ncbi:SIS domain-containing protein [Thermicanus aegyptius]|uniref:SIS domain-containing protein n=1 Tax=Thermicanus aegyptius TaxID=94009 RepID=UPI00042A74CA|nr:SIS domain-containing protein [Thermicanus aegyptius]